MLPTTLEGLDDSGVCVYIDEAGRGCFAGPVCAAAVVWPREYTPINEAEQKLLGMIKDSKKVTYDDILSSLNMKVINGKLQIVRGDADVLLPQQKTMVNHRQQLNTNVKASTNFQVPNVNAYSKQNEFYNKFLQAQNEPYQAPVVIDPLTPEEKKRLLMIQYIKHQQERQHISRVKSKKMNFV